MKPNNPIKARCPGSCGEFLQGWADGGEKLISYAIDAYSEAVLHPVPPDDANTSFRLKHPRTYAMAERTLRHYGKDPEQLSQWTLAITSQLPRAKGLASSTADLAAIASVIASALGKKPDAAELTRLCTSLEPTDSILYPDLVLMDPLSGTVSRRYDRIPPFSVMVLEGRIPVKTQGFRQPNHALMRQKVQDSMIEALAHFESGLSTGNWQRLADGCWISALANQSFFRLPGLHTLQRLAVKHGALGVNIAHSGSSAGLLHMPEAFDREGFDAEWTVHPDACCYHPPYTHRIIRGGVRTAE